MNTTAKHISLIVAGALMASAVASCGNAAPVETETAVPESSPSTEASVSESETTEEVTSETSFTVETEEKNNPLLDYSIENPNEYGYNAILILHQDETYRGIQYGFDNPYSISALRDYVYEITGEENDTITLSDVSYFQYNDIVSKDIDSESFSAAYTGESYKGIYLEGVRAIMATEDLRFGIDEIPTAYLQERFPRFFYDGYLFDADDLCFEDIDISEYDYDITALTSLYEVENRLYADWLLYTSCLRYNGIRAYYMYKNPLGSSVVLQVRDASTGMNVLVPTDAQAEAMQEDINCIPGCENISIFTPETPEEFYACYGYYPDELADEVVYENTSEGFEQYYNSLSEDEQDQIVFD